MRASALTWFFSLNPTCWQQLENMRNTGSDWHNINSNVYCLFNVRYVWGVWIILWRNLSSYMSPRWSFHSVWVRVCRVWIAFKYIFTLHLSMFNANRANNHLSLFCRSLFNPVLHNVGVWRSPPVLHGAGVGTVLQKWMHFRMASHLPCFKG